MTTRSARGIDDEMTNMTTNNEASHEFRRRNLSVTQDKRVYWLLALAISFVCCFGSCRISTHSAPVVMAVVVLLSEGVGGGQARATAVAAGAVCERMIVNPCRVALAMPSATKARHHQTRPLPLECAAGDEVSGNRPCGHRCPHLVDGSVFLSFFFFSALPNTTTKT